MSESHTPRPWFRGGVLCNENVSRFTIHDGDHVICEVQKRFGPDGSKDVGEANSCLIHAAPDLLAACKEAKFLAAHGIGAVTLGEDDWSRANSDRNIGEIKRIVGMIEAAIAKAGGAA